MRTVAAILCAALLAPGLAGVAAQPFIPPPAVVVKSDPDEGWYLTPGGVELSIQRGRLVQPVVCVPATDDPASDEVRCLWFVAGPCRIVAAGDVLVDAWWDRGRCAALPLVRNQ